MIQELRTATPEQKKHFFSQHKKLTTVGINGFKMLEPFKEFDKNGLKFPIDYLQEVGAYIIFLPVEYMAHYADAVCVGFTDSDFEDFKSQLNATFVAINSFDSVFEQVNATSIGNLAHIYLNCNNEEIKAKSKAILDIIHSKLDNYLLSLIN